MGLENSLGLGDREGSEHLSEASQNPITPTSQSTDVPPIFNYKNKINTYGPPTRYKAKDSVT